MDESQKVAEHKCGNSNEADEGKAKQDSRQVINVDVGIGWWPSTQSLTTQQALESIWARGSGNFDDQLLLEENEEDNQHDTNGQNYSKQVGEAVQLSPHPSEQRPQDLVEGNHAGENFGLPLDPPSDPFVETPKLLLPLPGIYLVTILFKKLRLIIKCRNSDRFKFSIKYWEFQEVVWQLWK